MDRFIELLRDAVRQVPVGEKGRVGRVAKLRRMGEKEQHSILKSVRSKRVPVENQANGA